MCRGQVVVLPSGLASEIVNDIAIETNAARDGASAPSMQQSAAASSAQERRAACTATPPPAPARADDARRRHFRADLDYDEQMELIEHDRRERFNNRIAGEWRMTAASKGSHFAMMCALVSEAARFQSAVVSAAKAKGRKVMKDPRCLQLVSRPSNLNAVAKELSHTFADKHDPYVEVVNQVAAMKLFGLASFDR